MPFFTYVAAAAKGPSDGPIDPSDPMAREAQTFPRLERRDGRRASPATAARSASRRGALVFSRGERSVDFFVVLDGSIEIFDARRARPAAGRSRSSAQRQFTGELDLFNDRQMLVSARAGEPSRAAAHQARRLPPHGLDRDRHRRDHHARLHPAPRRADPPRRTAASSWSARRTAPTRCGWQHFLSRNAYPHRLLDTEQDADAGGFLDCFSLDRRTICRS